MTPLLGAASCEQMIAQIFSEVAQEDASRTLQLDPHTSQIVLSIPKTTHEIRAHFEEFTGTLQLKGTTVTRLEIDVRVASLQSSSSLLNDDILSKDFLDAENFPSAHFESTQVTPVEGALSNYDVLGQISLHGVTHELHFPVHLALSPQKIEGRADLSLDPTIFGIDHPLLEAEMVEEGVTLEMNLAFPLTSPVPSTSTDH